MSVTLILTRNPLRSFQHGRQSGRWGELVAVKGPKVTAVTLSTAANSNSNAQSSNTIPVATGTLQLSTDGLEIGEVKRVTSMERFKTDNGKSYYVQLHPKTDPYWITFEQGNSAVRQLRPGHDGRCFRVHGGKPGPEQGILIHEAPHVGYLIGCLSPRPLKNTNTEFENKPGNPSYLAMNELFQFVGPHRADLFVLDW